MSRPPKSLTREELDQALQDIGYTFGAIVTKSNGAFVLQKATDVQKVVFEIPAETDADMVGVVLGVLGVVSAIADELPLR